MKHLLTLLFGSLCLALHAQAPKLVLPIGHTRGNGINKQRFTPNGKLAITAAEDMTVKVWDVTTGKLLHDLKGNAGSIASVDYVCSNNSLYLATADGFSTFTVYSLHTGEAEYSFPWTSENRILAFRFFPGETSLFLFDAGGDAWKATPQGLTLLYHITDAGASTYQRAALSANEAWLAAFSTGGALSLVERSTGKTVTHLSTTLDASACSDLFFSEKNTYLCAGYFGHDLVVWNLNTFERTDITHNYKANYTGVVDIAGDESYMAWTTPDEQVEVFDLRTMKMHATLNGHTIGVESLRFGGTTGKLITTGYDSTLIIWDVNSGAILKTFRDFQDVPGELDYNEPTGYFLAGIWNKTIGIWRIDNYKPVQMLHGFSSTITAHDVQEGGREVLTGDDEGRLRIWDVHNARIKTSIKGHSKEVTQASYLHHSPRMLTGSMDGTVRMWDATVPKPLYTVEGIPGGVKSCTFTANDSLLFTTSYNLMYRTDLRKSTDGTRTGRQGGRLEQFDNAGFCLHDAFYYTIGRDAFTLFNLTTQKQVFSFSKNESFFHEPCFSIAGDRVLLCSISEEVYVLSVPGGKQQLKINSGSDWLMGAEYRDEDRKIVTYSRYGEVAVWDAVTGTFLDSVKINFDNELYHRVSNDATRLLLITKTRLVEEYDIATKKKLPSTGIDLFRYNLHDTLMYCVDEAELLMFNLKNASYIGSFINVDTTGNLVLLRNGYYFGDKSSTRRLHYVKNGNIITFEQLDIKYNRPDKVLEAVGCTDTALINSYRKAYFKRIKKLGVDTSDFREGYSVPESDIQQREQLAYEQPDDTLRLHITSADKTYTLDRFNVWVNEVPVFGQRGIRLRKLRTKTFDTVVTVRLSKGMNRITCSVINVNGTESYRTPLVLHYEGTPGNNTKKGTLYFVGIGIDHFADKEYNLQYSTKDIRDLALKFREKAGPGISIDTLFNEQVTVERVKALKKKLAACNENDRVIISYSGHGLLSKDYDYYLSTYGVDFRHPEVNGLPYEELENLLDSIPARMKLLLIDACHSGEVDKEESFTMARTADSLGLSAAKGSKLLVEAGEQQVGLTNSFELMQSLFVNVGKSTGATIISAAAGNQFALERGDLKNGVFTYVILQAMNTDTPLRISELKKQVSERVEQITRGLQKPTFRNETQETDWELW